MEVPELEKRIGIFTYKSRSPGIGGKIKLKASDFVVEEITPSGIILEIGKSSFPAEQLNQTVEKEFLHATLEKKNWNTILAIRELAKKLGISRKRISFAGTKDKKAITSQRISIKGVKIEDLEKVGIKDIKLRDFSYEDKPIRLGDLYGNRFKIIIREISLDEKEILARIEAILSELRGEFPNFYGIQRFGSRRPITHLVGKEILKGNFKKAIELYLCEIFPEESEEAKEARRNLSESWDIKRALKEFPKYLSYENAILNHLLKNENDYVGALRRLPLSLRKMFVHAYQSYVFNKALSFYIDSGIYVEKLPLPGYKIKLDEVTEEILRGEGIEKTSFKVQKLKEISSKGEYRNCFSEFRNFSFKVKDNQVELNFILEKSCYATSLIREFSKGEYWL